MRPKYYPSSQRLLSLWITLLLLSSFGYQQPLAQPTGVVTVGSERADVALYQALLDLTNPWTVLCVAAHPDDEDGSTLTVMRRKYGVHTVSLFSTYGEGGQNAVGPELYEDLGVIRARETLAAAAVQGSEAHFLGMRDFGFSKSAEETFRIWGEKEALRRMVLQIRQIRPDVIITNHNTSSGHGHHQATGRLILQAFDAAADPQQFPEQLKQVSTWQPQRLFVRMFRNPDSTQAAPRQSVTINPNEIDPVRQISFAQQALNGLQQHATQGPWPKTVSPNGARLSQYNLVREAKGTPPLPADAKTPLDGLQLPESIRANFVAPTMDGKPLVESYTNRGGVLVSLINARKRGAFTASTDVFKLDEERFQLMTARLDTALAVAAGATLSLHSAESALIPGMNEKISAVLTNTGDSDIQIKHLEIGGMGATRSVDSADKLLPGTETAGDVEIATPEAEPLSVPSSEHLYDGRLFGKRLVGHATLEVEGAQFGVTTEKSWDVAPAVEIVKIKPPIYVRTPDTDQKSRFEVTLKNNLPDQFSGSIRLNGQDLETGRDIVVSAHTSETVALEVRTAIPVNMRNHAKSEVAISVSRPNTKQALSTRKVSTFYVNARVVPNLRVGYLPSFDDTLQRSLAALGVDARQLSVSEIQSGALRGFDTIIIDNRGYEAHPELVAANSQLLKYVEEGGTLIVCYHKTNEWNPNEKRPQLAPYPIMLDDERVTDEEAPVTFLHPDHRILNFPNKITEADFQNWIQERGLYFPREWDSHYLELLSTNDKGEPPLKGGLLVARYGKGNYIYTSFVWYRQLRGGIPGGYRFFANLISYR
jgi:LmbE family N-acetylglucosaminyl deacetylase